jgi:hypothetical protein
VPARVEAGDTIHDIGCRLIMDVAQVTTHIIREISQGVSLPRTPQWVPTEAKVYRRRDITDDRIHEYRQLLSLGVIEQFVAHPESPPRLVCLYDRERGRSVTS